ncbi:hypothetical protein [Ekhidna sp.]|uniref:hypothetical protein n=1 Tax=Ekhidna sp. TaxID=2608089 RepID=UPI0032973C93
MTSTTSNNSAKPDLIRYLHLRNIKEVVLEDTVSGHGMTQSALPNSSVIPDLIRYPQVFNINVYNGSTWQVSN